MSTYSSDSSVRPVVIHSYRRRRPATGRMLRVRAAVLEPSYSDFFSRDDVGLSSLPSAS